jgi:hypothetical protein
VRWVESKRRPAARTAFVAPALITIVILLSDPWARQAGAIWRNFMRSEAPARTNDDWRELARRIQKENDSEKMMELVHELLAKFDEEKLRKSLH